MNLYQLNKKITVARQNGFIFNQINKLTINFCSLLRYINISYYLKSEIPIMHCHFFRNLKIVILFKLFAMIEEILFILHVVNGIYVIIHNVT